MRKFSRRRLLQLIIPSGLSLSGTLVWAQGVPLGFWKPQNPAATTQITAAVADQMIGAMPIGGEPRTP